MPGGDTSIYVFLQIELCSRLLFEIHIYRYKYKEMGIYSPQNGIEEMRVIFFYASVADDIDGINYHHYHH